MLTLKLIPVSVRSYTLQKLVQVANAYDMGIQRRGEQGALRALGSSWSLVAHAAGKQDGYRMDLCKVVKNP